MRSADQLEYVGFWARTGAGFIDSIISMAVTLPLTFLMYARYIANPDSMSLGPTEGLINWGLPALFVIGFWVWKGATPGKMAISARVVNADTGEPLSVLRAVIRYLGYFVCCFSVGLGFLWVAFDRRKQGWHDKMANSVVVRPTGVPVRFGRQ
jgi:uncharacterized RDD family membrane protein YckC